MRKFVLRDIWNLNFEELSKTKVKLVGHLKVFTINYRHFHKLRCGREAVALSFFTTMATIPTLAIVMLIASRLGLDVLFNNIIYHYFSDHREIAEAIITYIGNMNSLTGKTAFGWFSIITFIWLVMWMMLCVEDAFNRVWGVKKSRNIFRRFGTYISILMVSPFIILLFFYGTIYYTRFINYLSGLRLMSFIGSGIYWLVFYAVSILALSIVYKIIPNTKVKYLPCLKASLISGIAFVGIQYLYLETQVMVTRLNSVYGVIAAIPLYMVWLNFCWFVILYGANLSYAFQHRDTYTEEEIRLEKAN
ncbi:MAG: YihY/virulence factor BrkB family protein [Bacteroidales bacterium]|nr:YihY/virulence factor BrkB family protein [Bacteroidales bacterium]